MQHSRKERSEKSDCHSRKLWRFQKCETSVRTEYFVQRLTGTSIDEEDRSKSGTDNACSSDKRSQRRSGTSLKQNRAHFSYLMTMSHPLYQGVYLQLTVHHHQTNFHAINLRRADARLDFQQNLRNLEKQNWYVISYKRFTSHKTVACMFP